MPTTVQGLMEAQIPENRSQVGLLPHTLSFSPQHSVDGSASTGLEELRESKYTTTKDGQK